MASLCSCASFSTLGSSRKTERICSPNKSLMLPFHCFHRKTCPHLRSTNDKGRAAVSSVRHATRAVSIQSDQVGSTQPPQEEKPTRYHFVVANAKFMLDEEEHFKEQLLERIRLFGERKKEQDFWLVIEPKFLDKFPNITKRLKRPAVALVSTDATWITFMKLRLDRVLTESFEADTAEEALASDPVDLHFEKPTKWTAPYPKYEPGWWEPFLPPKA